MVKRLANFFNILFHCLKNIFLIKILSFDDLIKLLRSKKKRRIHYDNILNLSKRIKRTNSMLGLNTCLNNSVCLYNFIKNDHQKIDFVIGVKRLNGEFSSHSWVELNNQPINETDLTQYSELLRINNL